MHVNLFSKLIKDYYIKNRRDLPWRNTTDSYRIVVSEIMLQQTQVSRVLVKYKEFIKMFPTWRALVTASNREVLRVWSGIGYNRRALYLKKIAELIVSQYKSSLPQNYKILIEFPGIGETTAGLILAFAFNMPKVFIETNIRRVFIHHFFPDQTNISDKEILPLVEKTLDKKNPREWYYALMDYGTYLAKQVENPNKNSKHYLIQSAFVGSNRQIRGAILRELLKKSSLSKKDIYLLPYKKEKLDKVLQELLKESFIIQKNDCYSIK